MRCLQRRAWEIGWTTLVFGVCLLAGAATAQAQNGDEYPRDSQGYYIAPDLSDVPFSLPEGTDSPEYREPLKGNRRQLGPTINSFYGEGFASDAVISSSVGNIRIAMENCDSTSHSTLDSRVVRVDLGRDNYAWRKVVDGILLRAAEFAWHHCPRTYWLANVWNNLDYLYDIHEVDVYLPNGNIAIRAQLGIWPGGDGEMWSGTDYTLSVEDVEGKRREEAAQLAQAQAEQQAQQAAQTQAEQEQIAAQQRYEAEARESEAKWSVLRPILWLMFIGGILFWKRNTLARWYYLLTPHPAHALVEHAIASGRPLDEHSFAELMADMPSNPVERQVRQEQAQQLAMRARQHAQRLLAEAERLREQARHEAQFIEAQEELAEATIEHELAKTRVDAYRKGASKHGE